MSKKLSLIELTPVVSNGVAYTSLDQIGQVLEVPRRGMSGAGRILQSILLINQTSAAFGWEMFFYDSLPDISSADNEALAYSSAAERDKIIAVMVSENQKNGSMSTGNGEFAMANFERFSSGLMLGESDTIYMAVRTNTTPTFTSTTSVRWVLGIEEVLNAR